LLACLLVWLLVLFLYAPVSRLVCAYSRMLSTNDPTSNNDKNNNASTIAIGEEGTAATSAATTATMHHNRPNHELTEEERSEKQSLKRLLKRQGKRRKYETRLHQAILRNDVITEERSRKELEHFLQQEQHESSKWKTHSLGFDLSSRRTTDTTSSGNGTGSVDQEESITAHHNSQQQQAKAQRDIEEIYNEYYRIIILLLQNQNQQHCATKQSPPIRKENKNQQPQDTTTNTNGTTLKEWQTAQARLLLLNMTKGTQTVDMFENQTALMGYVRQKFQERASLVIAALSKLDPQRQPPPKSPTSFSNQLQQQQQLRFWTKLLSVRSICSIGSGPGCDATGLVKFIHQFKNANAKSTPPSSPPGTERHNHSASSSTTVVDRVVFLDWTMDKWQLFLQPLIDGILIPNHYTAAADFAFCDVLRPFSSGSSNTVARNLLTLDNYLDHQGNSSSSSTEGATVLLDMDMFVTSYLLTETRGKWHAFYRDLVDMAKSGTLFFFAEPKAWQLHSFMEQNATKMEFVWLDSSMNNPEMQSLERRLGPAILLGMKL
jgi:hypothetical protein